MKLEAIEYEPQGLFYKENYITEKEHNELFSLLQEDFIWDGQPQRREVKQYGQIYNYRKQIFEDNYEPIPNWLQSFLTRLVDDEVFAEKPNQIIINKYRQTGNRNWSIPPHIDSAELFGKCIASITLGNSCIVEFCKAHHENEAGIIYTLKVHPRSLYFMTGKSRYEYYHRIPDKKYNQVLDSHSQTNVRISLTFRNIL